MMKTSTLGLLIIIAALAITTVTLLHDRSELKQDNAELRENRNFTAEVIKNYVAPDSTLHQVIKERTFTKTETTYVVDSAYMDSVGLALNVAKKQISDLLHAKARLEGRLKASAVTLDSLNRRVYRFNGEFLLATLTERDSVLRYIYNADIGIVKYWKRKWFLGERQYYIDLSSNDPQMKINGSYQFTIRPPVDRHPWGIGLQAGYYFDPETGTFRPAVGAGISYNLVRF